MTIALEFCQGKSTHATSLILVHKTHEAENNLALRRFSVVLLLMATKLPVPLK